MTTDIPRADIPFDQDFLWKKPQKPDCGGAELRRKKRCHRVVKYGFGIRGARLGEAILSRAEQLVVGENRRREVLKLDLFIREVSP